MYRERVMTKSSVVRFTSAFAVAIILNVPPLQPAYGASSKPRTRPTNCLYTSSRGEQESIPCVSLKTKVGLSSTSTCVFNTIIKKWQIGTYKGAKIHKGNTNVNLQKECSEEKQAKLSEDMKCSLDSTESTAFHPYQVCDRGVSFVMIPDPPKSTISGPKLWSDDVTISNSGKNIESKVKRNQVDIDAGLNIVDSKVPAICYLDHDKFLGESTTPVDCKTQLDAEDDEGFCELRAFNNEIDSKKTYDNVNGYFWVRYDGGRYFNGKLNYRICKGGVQLREPTSDDPVIKSISTSDVVAMSSLSTQTPLACIQSDGILRTCLQGSDKKADGYCDKALDKANYDKLNKEIKDIKKAKHADSSGKLVDFDDLSASEQDEIIASKEKEYDSFRYYTQNGMEGQKDEGNKSLQGKSIKCEKMVISMPRT